MRHKVAVLHEHCAAEGRDPAAVDASPTSRRARVIAAGEPREGQGAATVEEHVGRYRELAEAGVQTAIVGLSDAAGPSRSRASPTSSPRSQARVEHAVRLAASGTRPPRSSCPKATRGARPRRRGLRGTYRACPAFLALMVITRLVAGPRALRDGPTRTSTRYVRRPQVAQRAVGQAEHVPLAAGDPAVHGRHVPLLAGGRLDDLRCVTPLSRKTAICTVLAPAGTEAATVSVDDPLTASEPARGADVAVRGASACPSGTRRGRRERRRPARSAA